MKIHGFISHAMANKFAKDQTNKTGDLIRKELKIDCDEVIYVAIKPTLIKGRVSTEHTVPIGVAKKEEPNLNKFITKIKETTKMKDYNLKLPVADDDNIMHFGKHKGQCIADIPASYLIWLWNSGYKVKTGYTGEDGKLARYILKESHNLQKECKDIMIMDKEER